MTDLEHTDLELTRLAAYIEGEGCIHIPSGGCAAVGKNSNNRSVSVSVCNTDPRMPLWCFEHFGGNFSKNIRMHKRNPKWRSAFQWFIAAKEAENLLKLLMPYFICKKEQAQIAIDFRKTYTDSRRFGRHTLRQEVYGERTRLHGLMKLEKKRDWDDFKLPEVVNG